MMPSPLIELDHVTKIYGGGVLSKDETVALDDVCLTVDADTPQITAIVGESGSGKTTLASLLLGFLSPTIGKVLYEGDDVSKLHGAQMREFRRDIQAVFQDPFSVFNPFYKIDHVLTVPISRFKLASSKTQRHDLMVSALEAVGLRPDETLGRYPHQLSGGQRQRIIVARALMLRPKVIIADEPVSMVDASLRATILESLRKVNQALKVPILYITHDLGIGLPRGRPHPRDVPGQRGGGRRRRHRHQQPEAPVHAAADRLDPVARPEAQVGSGGRVTLGGHRRPGQAPGLPVRRALPVDDGEVPERAAAALPHPTRATRPRATCTTTRPRCRRISSARCSSSTRPGRSRHRHYRATDRVVQAEGSPTGQSRISRPSRAEA